MPPISMSVAGGRGGAAGHLLAVGHANSFAAPAGAHHVAFPHLSLAGRRVAACGQ